MLPAAPAVPLSVYMHALGGTGFTAYGGLLHIGALKDGEEEDESYEEEDCKSSQQAPL